MSEFRVGDVDVFFLSFDEPWADDFFEDLRSKVPRATRVHGVVGHDNMIKACAGLSRTRRFLTVDADNIVRPRLLNVVLDDRSSPDAVYSFRGLNKLNGLEYGNGGANCWPRSTALSMRTHGAAADEAGQVDFCWSTPTFVVDVVGSDVHVTGTRYHAFRAGYREAVKMTLVNGRKLEDFRQVKELACHSNWSRLMMWASVGADVPNGQWAIYGVRRALVDIWVDDVPITSINDYSWFDAYWKQVGDVDPVAEALALGAELNSRLDLGLIDLTSDSSRWVKEVYVNSQWSGLISPARTATAGPAPRRLAELVA